MALFSLVSKRNFLYLDSRVQTSALLAQRLLIQRDRALRSFFVGEARTVSLEGLRLQLRLHLELLALCALRMLDVSIVLNFLLPLSDLRLEILNFVLLIPYGLQLGVEGFSQILALLLVNLHLLLLI